MRKLLVSMVGLLVLTVAAIPAAAQTRARCTDRSDRRYEQRSYDRRDYDQRRVATYNSNRIYDSRYRTNVYNGAGYSSYDNYYYDNRSVWDRSRDKITTAIGAGTGAAVGGLIGGRRGAIVGAIAGGGGAAIYTYGIRNKNNYYRR